MQIRRLQCHFWDARDAHGTLDVAGQAALGKTIGSLGAARHAGLRGAVVGIEISATHHRGARDGEVTAVATLAHGG